MIVRLRITASTGVIALAAVATTWGLACSHDLEQFEKGKDTGVSVDVFPETDTAIDDTAIDDTIDAADVEIDAEVNDSDMGDTVASDGDATPDVVCMVPTVDAEVPDADAGPPPVVTSCTTIGPPNSVCVSGATFSFGTSRAACVDAKYASEGPEVSVKTSAFFIDEHEVSVGRFRAWWNSTSRAWPVANATVFTGSTTVRWRTTGTNPFPTAPSEPAMAPGCTWLGAADATNDDKPLNCVDWFTAFGFCLAEGKRLPTEAEWEFVASGGEDRLFPWSPKNSEEGPLTTVTCAEALHNPSCPPQTTPRDSTVWGRSKWGVWNMAGSVAEWTLDEFTPNHSSVPTGVLDYVADPTGSSTRVVRGGSSISSFEAMRAAARVSGNPANKDAQIGFRCVKR